jgi:hypothetical protein
MVKKASVILMAALVFALLSFPSRAEAAEFISGPTVTVGPGEVIDNDLYASGGTVVVQGTINGDLVAAGGTINVEGMVNGDVILAGGDLTISGMVQDDVRAAGGQLDITSSIGSDVIFAGGTLTIGPNAAVGQDLVVAAGGLQMAGTVARDVSMSVDSARIEGIVVGDVEGNVGDRLTLGPTARIEGNLEYGAAARQGLSQGRRCLVRPSGKRPPPASLA